MIHYNESHAGRSYVRLALFSDAGGKAAYRFERGVHPAVAEQGVLRGLEVMQEVAGGTIARGLVDDAGIEPA